MAEAELERLVRDVEARPEEAATWIALARQAARLERVPPVARRPVFRLALGRAQAATPGDRELARLLLAAHDLTPAGLPGEPLRGDHWARPGRYRVEEGSGWCQETGLPLRVTRRRDGAEMALVPGGPGVRGGLGKEALPMRRVHVSTRYMDVLPVTAARFARFVESGAEEPGQWAEQGQGDRPVIFVGPRQAEDYAAWAGARLPSEAEWEKAARGPAGRWYPWGQGAGAMDHGDHVGPDGPTVLIGTYDWVQHLGEVGAHPAGRGPYGHQDLMGGVDEWTLDGFHPNVGAARPVPDPVVPAAPGAARLVKGGNWMGSGLEPSWWRGSRPPDWRAGVTGFRLALGFDEGPQAQPGLELVPADAPPAGISDEDLDQTGIEAASEAMDFLVLDLEQGYVMMLAGWVLGGRIGGVDLVPGEVDLAAVARAVEGGRIVECEERDGGMVMAFHLESGDVLVVDKRRTDEGPVFVDGALVDRYGRVVSD